MTTPVTDEVSAAELLIAWIREGLSRLRATGPRGVVLGGLGAGLGIAVALILPPQFTSSATFVAQGASSSAIPSALLGIAASVGFGSAKDYSPQFYADLLTSDPVLTSAVQRSYTLPGSGDSTRKTYVDIEDITGSTPAAVLDGALRHLRRRVAARADVRTNIVTVAVTTRTPVLSRDLTQAVLDALDSMNIGFRQEQSRELRQFFEGRVADAQAELDSAETALRRFLERNRATDNSPLLRFEQLRLTRTADLKRAVYTTVVQQYEEAKMQEARNVPVLTVLTSPTLPVRKSGPPRRFIVALGLALGVLLALGLDAVSAQRR